MATPTSTERKTDSPTPKTKRPSRPRVDPEIMKIRRRYASEVKEHLRRRASGKVLKTVIEKRLPRLVQSDLEKLLDVLSARATAALPGILPEPEPAPAPKPTPEDADCSLNCGCVDPNPMSIDEA